MFRYGAAPAGTRLHDRESNTYANHNTSGANQFTAHSDKK
jgi:hypothetical protein